MTTHIVNGIRRPLNRAVIADHRDACLRSARRCAQGAAAWELSVGDEHEWAAWYAREAARAAEILEFIDAGYAELPAHLYPTAK
jgi:hypothetical protein